MISNIKSLIKKNRIIRRIFFFFKGNYQQRRIRSMKKYGPFFVQMIENSLKSTGLTYFATCGTLLGLIRENKLLKNDYDMDYGILIRDSSNWVTLDKSLNKIGFHLIREFSFKRKITERTYRRGKSIDIDFFGHFIENGVLCFYSYDKLKNVIYPSESAWTVYVLKNGPFVGTKKIETGIGIVTVPRNAEEYLTYNYNDNWMIPDPTFKANTGKGCTMIADEFGIIKEYK